MGMVFQVRSWFQAASFLQEHPHVCILTCMTLSPPVPCTQNPRFSAAHNTSNFSCNFSIKFPVKLSPLEGFLNNLPISTTHFPAIFPMPVWCKELQMVAVTDMYHCHGDAFYQSAHGFWGVGCCYEWEGHAQSTNDSLKELLPHLASLP